MQYDSVELQILPLFQAGEPVTCNSGRGDYPTSPESRKYLNPENFLTGRDQPCGVFRRVRDTWENKAKKARYGTVSLKRHRHKPKSILTTVSGKLQRILRDAE